MSDMVAGPEEPEGKLKILTAEERHQLIVDWNDTRRDYPPDVCLHELIEGQADGTPDAVAVRFENRELRYRELEARANRVANRLRKLGVGPEVLVGICMERSLELVVALLGVLKAGGAYVPLDPDYPNERLAFMLSDTRTSLILTQKSLSGRLPADGAQLLSLDAEWGEFAGESPERPRSGASSENLAYVIYTSGSTGRPKGAMNTHRGICNRLLWMQEEYGLTAADRVLQKTPFSFDVSVWEFFWPLMTEARLVLARPGGHKDSRYLARLIQDEQITVLHFVPSMLRLFLEEESASRCSSLRDVVCSGEALSPELQKRFSSLLKANLHNLYGPTEAAIDVTYWRCSPDADDGIVPIGRPVANTQIHMLDSHYRPVPVGVAGELHIGGVQVGRGYWNRPELTAERFVADPFHPGPGARLYKTGDLARYLPDGNIEFLGRKDHQVKIRGFRVELGEIETVLERHPAVRQAVVIAREDVPGDKRLVGYLVRGSREMPRIEELRRFAGETLPDYMIPSAFVTLDSLPLTPNGKVDRQALPAPTRERPELEEAFVGPRTELEEFLVGLWREILRLDRVGVRDRFFELGGDSILAARFINLLQKELRESIYIVSIFEAPTVAEYAVFLEREYGGAVAKRFQNGANVPGASGSAGAARADGRIDEGSLEYMRQILPKLPEPENPPASEPKNPPALFVFAPPRSGTTLLRVMLAGHPGLFSCSELQLLGFHTLQQRREAFSGKFGLWLEGTLRAIMELKECDADGAKRIMAEYERRNCTTRGFYRKLQEWSGDRLLVDKTPFYALDIETLRKAELDFENPLYIHLIRHPYAMVRSFEGYHMNQVLRLGEHSFSGRELGELVWTISHQNILDFLENVPAERRFRMHFEQLVTEPRKTVGEMCERLRLEFHPGLLEPYADHEQKMIDGVHDVSTPMGDRHFEEHRRINPDVAERWKGVIGDNFLGEVTWQVARSLGYEAPAEPRRQELRKERRRRRLRHRSRSGPGA